MLTVLNSLLIRFSKRKGGQKDLARQLEKNEHTISNWCINKSQPHLKDLYRIAEILKVNVCDLLIPGDYQK